MATIAACSSQTFSSIESSLAYPTLRSWDTASIDRLRSYERIVVNTCTILRTFLSMLTSVRVSLFASLLIDIGELYCGEILVAESLFGLASFAAIESIIDE